MHTPTTSPKLAFVLFLLLALVTGAPVWAVTYFVNQDGPGHVYSAKIMYEILRGHPVYADVYALNSLAIPNSTGHWLMALLIPVFSAFTVTKIIVSLTFLGFAASVAWLRARTVGGGGDVATGVLFGFVLGYNWLWMLGSYNFIIGVIVFVATLGLYDRWRESMTPVRALVLSGLLALAFLSHIISFLILAGSLALLAVAVGEDRRKTLFWTAAAYLPSLPLILIYKSLSRAGEPFQPAWRNLADPFSLASWLRQFSTPDPFVLLSRKTLPFASAESTALILFAPIVWILTGVLLLALATALSARRGELLSRKYLPFTLLFGFSMLAVMFAPDDFGLTNGSVLRERLLLCGLVFVVPLFRTDRAVWAGSLARICFLYVIVFQTAVMWEYARRVDVETAEYLAARPAVAAGERIASVNVLERTLRFHSNAVPQLVNYYGFGENVVVWDNYEIGHYLFPVVARRPEDKDFVFRLTTSNAFPLDNPAEKVDDTLVDLERVLTDASGRLDKLLLWGDEPRVEALIRRYCEPEPVFARGRLRVFLMKNPQLSSRSVLRTSSFSSAVTKPSAQSAAP